MTEQKAFELTQQYIIGWKQNDLRLITSCLTDDCTIIESHGPIYTNIANVKKWFEFWLAAKSVILKWELNSFYFYSKKHTAFCEWDFQCTSNNAQYTLSGASIIKFRDGKISYIKEYRLIRPPFEWEGNNLISE